MDGILFLILASLTIITSIKVAYYANGMENNTNINSNFIGGIILAGVTSLPELITCLTAVFINNPYMALGDIVGSNIFNLFILAIFDILFIKKMFFNKISNQYFYINALIVYIYIVIINAFFNKSSLIILNMGLPTILIILSYLIYVFFLERINNNDNLLNKKELIKHVKTKFIFMAFLMVIVSVSLTFSADYLAFKHPQFSSSIIGAFLVGITTSLPEVVSVYALLKFNNFNLAFSNIIGSNMFNLLILAFADIFYPNGSIYLFGDYQSLIIVKATLYINLLLFIGIMRKKNISKLSYIIPSFMMAIIYLYLWISMMMP